MSLLIVSTLQQYSLQLAPLTNEVRRDCLAPIHFSLWNFNNFYSHYIMEQIFNILSVRARWHSMSLQPGAVSEVLVVEALDLDCRPKHIAPAPLDSLCGSWAHRRLNPLWWRRSYGDALDLPDCLRSHPPLWSWALDNDWKNKIADTNCRNEFPL